MKLADNEGSWIVETTLPGLNIMQTPDSLEARTHEDGSVMIDRDGVKEMGTRRPGMDWEFGQNSANLTGRHRWTTLKVDRLGSAVLASAGEGAGAHMLRSVQGDTDGENLFGDRVHQSVVGFDEALVSADVALDPSGELYGSMVGVGIDLSPEFEMFKRLADEEVSEESDLALSGQPVLEMNWDRGADGWSADISAAKQLIDDKGQVSEQGGPVLARVSGDRRIERVALPTRFVAPEPLPRPASLLVDTGEGILRPLPSRSIADIPLYGSVCVDRRLVDPNALIEPARGWQRAEKGGIFQEALFLPDGTTLTGKAAPREHYVSGYQPEDNQRSGQSVQQNVGRLGDAQIQINGGPELDMMIDEVEAGVVFTTASAELSQSVILHTGRGAGLRTVVGDEQIMGQEFEMRR